VTRYFGLPKVLAIAVRRRAIRAASGFTSVMSIIRTWWTNRGTGRAGERIGGTLPVRDGVRPDEEDAGGEVT
jgi:hypothetical protein